MLYGVAAGGPDHRTGGAEGGRGVVAVPHRERLTKLVVVALVGVPKLHTQV